MEEILNRPMDPIQLPLNLDPDAVTGQEARTERCQGPQSEDVPMTTRPARTRARPAHFQDLKLRFILKLGGRGENVVVANQFFIVIICCSNTVVKSC